MSKYLRLAIDVRLALRLRKPSAFYVPKYLIEFCLHRDWLHLLRCTSNSLFRYYIHM